MAKYRVFQMNSYYFDDEEFQVTKELLSIISKKDLIGVMLSINNQEIIYSLANGHIDSYVTSDLAGYAKHVMLKAGYFISMKYYKDTNFFKIMKRDIKDTQNTDQVILSVKFDNILDELFVPMFALEKLIKTEISK